MKPKLVIFDLDGTLLDTFGDLQSAVNAALLKNGMPLRTLPEIKRFVGNGVKKLVERAVPTGTKAASTEVVFRDFSEEYKIKKNETTAPYEGMDSLLTFLRAHGVATAVLSNKIDAAVKELVCEMLPGVDYARGETDSVPRKPDPAGVCEILSKIRAKKEETVLVGDSEIDAETAKNAGLRFVAVLWGAREKSDFVGYEPDRCVESVAELKRYFIDVWGL